MERIFFIKKWKKWGKKEKDESVSDCFAKQRVLYIFALFSYMVWVYCLGGLMGRKREREVKDSVSVDRVELGHCKVKGIWKMSAEIVNQSA